MTITQEQVATAQTMRSGIIDCDVHPMPRSLDEIRSYMPMPWRDRYTGGGRGFFSNPIHGEPIEDPTVEAYLLTVEDGVIVRHVRMGGLT